MFMYRSIIKDILKITIISIIMSFIIRFGVWGLMADISVYSLILKLLSIMLLILIGGIFYCAGIIFTRVLSIKELKNILKR